MVNPHFSELILSWFTACFRWFRNKFIKKLSTFIENNQLEEFDLAYRFKNSLKLIMICFTFSPAIPILNMVVLAGLFSIFWIHKRIFITYSGKSPSYSSRIIIQIIHQLKITFLMHIVMATIFISNKDVFPQNPNYHIDNYELSSYADNYGGEIFLRLLKALPIVLVGCLGLVIFIFKPIFSLLIRIFTCCCKKKVHRLNFETYDKMLKLMRKKGIYNYSILSNPKYRPLIYFSKNDLQKIHTFIRSTSVINLLHLSNVQLEEAKSGRGKQSKSSIKISN